MDSSVFWVGWFESCQSCFVESCQTLENGFKSCRVRMCACNVCLTCTFVTFVWGGQWPCSAGPCCDRSLGDCRGAIQKEKRKTGRKMSWIENKKNQDIAS